MIITGIKASNFKILKSVNVEIPDGTGIIKIIGDNGAGKSSLIEAIETTLTGKKPFEAIKHGEEEAIITVKLKDDKLGYLSVTKVLKKDKKATLIIRGANNTTFNAPQEMLDSFIGALSFDPLSFFSLKEEKQYAVLKDMLGLGKLDELDAKNTKDYDARTEINREIKQKRALKEAIKLSDDEFKQVDVKKLVDKLQRVNEKNNKLKLEQQEHEHKIIRVKELEVKIKKLKEELRLAEVQHVALSTEIENHIDVAPTGVDEIKKEIKDAEGINENYAKHQKKEEFVIDITNLQDASDALSNKILSRNMEKMKLLDKAEIDKIIPGLNLDQGIIRYNGVCLQECSTAERIKVSFAIGVASNYKLRMIFIREGSLLDKKNMKLIKELAKEKDYNIIIELLNDNGEEGMKIVIEQGEVV